MSMRACEEEMSLLISEEVEVKFIKEVKCEKAGGVRYITKIMRNLISLRR